MCKGHFLKYVILYFSLSFYIFCYAGNDKKLYEEIYNESQNIYGIDQELINGVFYENKYYKAIGHPFLLKDEFFPGEINLRGKLYKDIELKYDIFEQHIIINYSYDYKKLWVVLPDEFISEFSFKGMSFKKFEFPGHFPTFYQVIGNSDELQCLYHWSKKRNDSDHLRVYFSYEFTDEGRASYLLLDGQLLKYYNNLSFIKKFPKAMQNQVRKYIKSHDIKVSKSKDKLISDLIDYCVLLKTENNY